jgi:hypothetical protein
MTADTVVKTQIGKLIAEVPALLPWDEQRHLKAGTQINFVGCLGWMAAAAHVIEIVCPNPSTAYRKQFDALVAEWKSFSGPRSGSAPEVVPATTELLRRLLADIEAGLLVNIANKAVAETFDNFLDHAAHYLTADQKNEAGVIAGIVFEDTIRKICRLHEIAENGVNLDKLVTELVNRELLTGLKAKRARASAALRTSAAHARWEEFDAQDVKPVIELTRELLAAHLDNS